MLRFHCAGRAQRRVSGPGVRPSAAAAVRFVPVAFLKEEKKPATMITPEEHFRRVFATDLYGDGLRNGYVGRYTAIIQRNPAAPPDVQESIWCRTVAVNHNGVAAQVNLKTGHGQVQSVRPQDGLVQAVWDIIMDKESPECYGLNHQYTEVVGQGKHDVRMNCAGLPFDIGSFIPLNICDTASVSSLFVECLVYGTSAEGSCRCSMGLGYGVASDKSGGDKFDPSKSRPLIARAHLWEPRFVRNLELEQAIDLPGMLQGVQEPPAPLDPEDFSSWPKAPTGEVRAAHVQYDHKARGLMERERTEAPDLEEDWGASDKEGLFAPHVPEGYRCCTYVDGAYSIAPSDLRDALAPARPLDFKGAPWLMEFGVLGCGGRWVRARLSLDPATGWADSWRVLDLAPTQA